MVGMMPLAWSNLLISRAEAEVAFSDTGTDADADADAVTPQCNGWNQKARWKMSSERNFHQLGWPRSTILKYKIWK